MNKIFFHTLQLFVTDGHGSYALVTISSQNQQIFVNFLWSPFSETQLRP